MPQSRRPPSSTRIPASFVAKKSQILSSLTQPEDEYSDKSPKGTVDHQILRLIQEINGYDGLVTTSSCAGRVAVFVEGLRSTATAAGDVRVNDAGEGEDEDEQMTGSSAAIATTTTTTTTTSPGGKGGGKWLYVSHDPIGPLHGQNGTSTTAPDFTTLFNLTPSSSSNTSSTPPMTLDHNTNSKSPRLIHLTFSPLILHVHCATLRHARPLVAAAINSGFRESGVQSLRVLDDPGHGVMVAIRTAGLSFETVVGVVSPASSTGPDDERRETNQDVMQSVVSEDYLAMCAGVVNERFRWNHERRERFRVELKRAMAKEGYGFGPSAASGEENTQWEDKDVRRRRKREEGLARQKRERQEEEKKYLQREIDSDELDEGLGVLKVG